MNNNCICYDDEISVDMVTLSCNHSFHSKCLLRWYNSNISIKKQCCYCTKPLKWADYAKIGIISIPNICDAYKLRDLEQIKEIYHFYKKQNKIYIASLQSATEPIIKLDVLKKILTHQYYSEEYLDATRFIPERWIRRCKIRLFMRKANNLGYTRGIFHQEIINEFLKLDKSSQETLYYIAYEWSAMYGYLEIIQLFIEKINTNLDDAMIIIYIASKHGNTQIVEYILANTGISTLSREILNDSLYRASECGYSGIVEALLNAGADPRHDGERCIMSASCNGNTKVVMSLLSHGADPNVHNYPLMAFVCDGNLDVTKLLLDYGAVLNNPEYDLLEIACELNRGSLEMMKFLLDQGINITQAVIKSAIKSRRSERVKMLFDYKQNIIIDDPNDLVAVSKILEKIE